MPSSVRKICHAAFCKCERLKKVVINEGLAVLGTEKPANCARVFCGVFDRSAVEDVRLPSTLKKIECSVFQNCEHLKNIKLPHGLEKIGLSCFRNSAIEEVTFPASVKEVGVSAFLDCKQLKNVQLNEGLEKLGENAFSGSAISSVTLPSTLRIVEAKTF